MASEYYVDPQNGSDSTGDGSIGTPWASVQHALDNITRDTSDGDRINVRDTADDVLASALSLATYGTPTGAAPLIIQGYSSSAGDGGIGGISGDGSVSIFDSTSIDYIHWIDLHLHNTGSNRLLRIDRYCIFEGCEFDNTTSNGLQTGAFCRTSYCHFHNIGTYGLVVDAGCLAAFNTFENGTNDFAQALRITSFGSAALFNVFDIDGATIAINITEETGSAIGNSIYSSGGTGTGIDIPSGGAGAAVISNIIEGFSGTGGTAIEVNDFVSHVINNAYYNNATDLNVASGQVLVQSGNQSLDASPFADAANDDFTVGTSVQALAFPTNNYPGLSVRSYLDIGALQREEPTASETILPVRGRNTLLRR